MNARKWIAYALAALLTPAIVGGLRARSFLAREAAPFVAASFVEAPAPEPHDPSKPTVAVVLGADVTEITDMVGPYEMFARTFLYNVYAVAPTPASTTLTGGLRVRPHYSFAELDRLLDGASPAVVVAPNIPNIQAPQNRPVVEWVRRSADSGATSLSWCAGAAVLAEAGLLDGRTATSHWGDLARLDDEYPRVEWRRGLRWIDHGSVVTSAGITSGIDATLRVLVRSHGEEVARRVAAELRYPNFHFALQPEAEQYSPRLSDAVLFLNAAFQPVRPQIGLALYDGVGELDVSTVYDAHAAAGVAEVRAAAARAGPVRTKHGLVLEPALTAEHDGPEIAALDRVIDPGRAARTDRSSLESTLEDLARTADVATATFAQRRLEYRSNSLRLQGNAVPIGALLSLLALAIAGGVLPNAVRWAHGIAVRIFAIQRPFDKRSSSAEGVSGMNGPRQPV